MNHIISECIKLAQKEYKRKHNKVEADIHWELCKQFGFSYVDKWDQYEPDCPGKQKSQKYSGILTS